MLYLFIYFFFCSDFFPYNTNITFWNSIPRSPPDHATGWWTGFYTSRPVLKGLSENDKVFFFYIYISFYVFLKGVVRDASAAQREAEFWNIVTLPTRKNKTNEPYLFYFLFILFVFF